MLSNIHTSVTAKVLLLLVAANSCYTSHAFLAAVPLSPAASGQVKHQLQLKPQQGHSQRLASLALAAATPTPEESAKVLTDYMAKAHEEKLTAIKAAEDKKQSEIEVRTVPYT